MRFKPQKFADEKFSCKPSRCKAGEGFPCSRCSATCSYDDKFCYTCMLKCCYMAGVGAVTLEDEVASGAPNKCEMNCRF